MGLNKHSMEPNQKGVNNTSINSLSQSLMRTCSASRHSEGSRATMKTLPGPCQVAHAPAEKMSVDPSLVSKERTWVPEPDNVPIQPIFLSWNLGG